MVDERIKYRIAKMLGRNIPQRVDRIFKRLLEVTYDTTKLVGYSQNMEQGYYQPHLKRIVVNAAEKGNPTILHESIHAEDIKNRFNLRYLPKIEAATHANSLRALYNRDIMSKDFEDHFGNVSSYSELLLLGLQVERITGRQTMDVIGEEATFEDYYKSFFSEYFSGLEKTYYLHQTSAILREAMSFKSYDFSNTPKWQKDLIDGANGIKFKRIAHMMEDCQNRLLVNFAKHDLKKIENLEDACQFFERMQEVGMIRKLATDTIHQRDESISEPKEDIVFNSCYISAMRRAKELLEEKGIDSSQLNEYSIERFKDWRDNAEELFNLQMGQKRFYQYHNRIVMLESQMEGATTKRVTKKLIPEKEFEKYQKKYEMTRYYHEMVGMADEEQHYSGWAYLRIGDRHYLYKDVGDAIHNGDAYLVQDETPIEVPRKLVPMALKATEYTVNDETLINTRKKLEKELNNYYDQSR